MIQGDQYEWSEKNVNLVKTTPAVYELYSKGVLIYIGSSGNLSARFKGYHSSNFSEDTCKKPTDGYKREYVQTEGDARSKERSYLTEFQKANNSLPRCNDVIP